MTFVDQPKNLNQETEEDSGLRLHELREFFLRHWRRILVTGGVFGVISLAITFLITPKFTASADVLLEQKKDKIFEQNMMAPGLALDTSYIDSQIPVIQSINVLKRVVVSEKLDEDPEFNGSEGNLFSFISSNRSLFDFSDSKDENEKDADIPRKVLVAINNLRNALDVRRVQKSYVISISVTLRDKLKAVKLANAVAGGYVLDQVQGRFDAAKQASVWLADSIHELREQVRQSEEAVVEFRRNNDLLAASSGGQTTVTEQQLSELNEKLVLVQAEAAEKKAKYEQAKDVLGHGGDPQSIPDVVRSATIQNLREQQAEVSRKEADLSARLSARHPTLINTRAEKRDIDRSITLETQRILVNLKNDYDVAAAREKSLRSSLDEITGKTGANTAVGVKLHELERMNAANKTIFENFLSHAKVTQEQSKFEEHEARIISPATKPQFRSSPKRFLTFAIGTVLGLCLGTAGIVAFDKLNPGFISAGEIERKLNMPVLGLITRNFEYGERSEKTGLKKLEKAVDKNKKEEVVKSQEPSAVIIEKPFSRLAEIFRSVRHDINLINVDAPPKIIIVTSALPGEGKSSIARAITYSAALTKQKVLLIDCDLRNPVNSKFHECGKRVGLTDFLGNDADLDSVKHKLENIDFIPTGKRSHLTTELLSSQKMKHLLDDLRAQYDLIVLDTPPMELIIDAKVLANIADTSVFVVQWNATPRQIVERHVHSLERIDKIAGLILNKVDEKSASRYGAYGYGKYGKNGYGYGNYGKYYNS